MILILKNATGSSGCHKTGKLISQTIDTQKVGVSLNGIIDRQTTSQPMQTNATENWWKNSWWRDTAWRDDHNWKLYQNKDQKYWEVIFFFSPSLRTEELRTGVSRPDVRVHHANSDLTTCSAWSCQTCDSLRQPPPLLEQINERCAAGKPTKHTGKQERDRCWSGRGLESPSSDSALPCQLQLTETETETEADKEG